MTSLLLDTNLLSELVKRKPDPSVVRWFGGQNSDATFLSVVTLGELSRGIERLPASRRRTELEAWLASLFVDFNGRILGVDPAVALRWGRLVAKLETAGRGYGVLDALLAATALEHGLTIVTPNTRDFEHIGVRVFNPWK